VETIELKSWEEFQERLKFPSPSEQYRQAIIESRLPPSKVIYRGQSNADWPLDTTLQRVADKIRYDFDFVTYIEKAVNLADSIDTHTGSNWDLGSFGMSFKTYEDFAKGNLEQFKRVIEYLIYLRHCGFPSPLLDWTVSPYIAAFFAFCDISHRVEKVAIYAFQEMPSGFKHIFYDKQARIKVIGFPGKTHKRHYLQQVQYTLCLKDFGETQGFGNYEEALEANKEDCKELEDDAFCQDLLIKYTIPAKERNNVLRQLDKMNISYVSLFDTEDALIKTLAVRELELWKE